MDEQKFLLSLITIRIKAPQSWDDKKAWKAYDAVADDVIPMLKDHFKELLHTVDPEITFTVEDF